MAKTETKKSKPEEQYTVSEFAVLVGRTEQQIYRMLRQDKLGRNADGYLDLSDVRNVAYAAARGVSPGKAAKAGRGISLSLPATAAAGPLPGQPVSGLPKSEIERLKAIAQLHKLQLANRRASGELVERPAVFAFVSRLVAILNSELLALPQRTSADLAAAARGAGSDDEATVVLDALLSRELYSAVRSVVVSGRKFIKDLYGETEQSAGPLLLEQSLEETRELLARMIAEVRKQEPAA